MKFKKGYLIYLLSMICILDAGIFSSTVCATQEESLNEDHRNTMVTQYSEKSVECTKTSGVKIWASNTNANIGDNVIVYVSITAATWNVKVSGSGVSDSVVGVNLNVENETTTKTYNLNTSNAGIYTVSLSGDVTDASGVSKPASGSVTINVAQKETQEQETPSQQTEQLVQLTQPTFVSANKIMYTTGWIYLRSSYSTSSAAISVPIGTELVVTGTSTERVNGYIWYRVSYNGQTMYVANFLLTGVKPNGAQESDTKTFADNEEQDYYYANDKDTIQTGWFRSDGETYYADINGKIASGLYKIGENSYYFNPYLIRNKFINVNGNDYYVNENGIIQIGWFQAKGFIGNSETTCYANGDGVVQKGFCTIGGNKYYFNPYIYKNKFKYVEECNGNFYFDSNGIMQTGLFDVGDKTYYANKDGYVQYGLISIGGSKYYFGDYMIKNDFVDIYDDLACEYYKYYFDKNGKMQIGWFNVSGTIYYSGENGKIASGWTTIGGRKYYFNDGLYRNVLFSVEDDEYYAGEDGAIVEGIVLYDDKVYCFDENCKRIYVMKEDGTKDYSRIIKIDDNLYFIDNYGEVVRQGWMHYGDHQYYTSCITGELYTGFNDVDGCTYYFNENGEMQVGKIDIRGQSYYFDTDERKFLKGKFITIDNKMYYFGRITGMLQKVGWYTKDGKQYYLDPTTGEVAVGLKQIGEKEYYFNESGIMEKGKFITIGGKIYYFGKKSGTLQKTGWYTKNDNKYYLDPTTGEAAVGLKQIGDKEYYFNENGIMEKGKFVTIDGKIYYFGKKTGTLQETGWYTKNDNKYYLDPITGEVAVGLTQIGEKEYYFNESGIMEKGKFITIDGKIYYFGKKSGTLQKTGWYTKNENKYYLDLITGEVAVGRKNIDGEVYYFDKCGVMQIK